MVAPVHLEFFDSVDAIADAKAEILEGLGPDGVAVLNGDDPRVRRIGEQRTRDASLWFGRDRALRRLRGELARHRPRHALRPARWAARPSTWPCPCPGRTSC